MIVVLCSLCSNGIAQDTVLIEKLSEFEFPSQGFYIPSSYANQIDNTGRAYVYTANKHAGVITFDVSNLAEPYPVDTLTVEDFLGIRPTNVTQQNKLLYVALGEFEGLGTQSAGLAIVNIENPEHPVILGQWDSLTFDKGCPIAVVSGGYAYLGAMDWGVIILDVSEPRAIKFVSQLTLDRLYPKVPTLTSEPHARGLAVYGNKLLVAHDAGGLRVVDISNKSLPIEEVKYVNDSMFNITQVAYNKVAVYDDRAYITTDYCGMEIVDLTNLPNINQGEWHNPFNCMPQTWVGGEGHTNGIKILESEQLVFISAGDTEVLVYDISDGNLVVEVGRYQMPDSTVAWSLDVRDDLIVLSCIDNHLFPFQPYYADFGGIILLKWKREVVAINEKQYSSRELIISPNPSYDKINISFDQEEYISSNIFIYNIQGGIVYFVYSKKSNTTGTEQIIDISKLVKGPYIVVARHNQGHITKLFMKQ